ncbi:MAG: hypothetical protein QOI78_4395 [Actinomycetota bacterium]|nr:hypothetical protein [Actinomycetota bacterium]
MTEHLPIAIIGGGLGGLTTAVVLHRRGIHATILELEPDRAGRTQGGMLDIHDDSGQLALKAAGLHEKFLTLVHPGGESMRIRDHTGRLLHSDDDEGQLERPEIDRGHLRDLLLDALPDDVVRWGNKVTAVIPDDGVPGRHHIRLGDGTEYTTDLLIGADGAWSRVRPLVSDAQPVYSGISFVEADVLNADARHPALAATMGPGMLFALGGATGILGHKETDGSIHFYLGHRADETWVDNIDFGDRAASTRAVLRLMEGWAEDLRGFIVHADTPLIPRRIYALPVGHRWDRVPGVTLLGDAAHLMSPFAGEGANLALYDAFQLATSIADCPEDSEAALAAYENDMFARAEDAAGLSARMLELIFASDAPRGLVDAFASFGPAQPDQEPQHVE